jgi:hypothetical protein
MSMYARIALAAGLTSAVLIAAIAAAPVHAASLDAAVRKSPAPAFDMVRPDCDR